jgi:uncharacterized membrane protein YbhN (UPF0104 family)
MRRRCNQCFVSIGVTQTPCNVHCMMQSLRNETETGKRGSKSPVRVALSLAVSAVFIALSLRNTDARAVVTAMGRADGWILAAYVGTLLVVHVIRAVRWGLLLAPLGRVSFSRVNSATAIGFMLLMTLPLRLGELGRPLLVSRPAVDGAPRLPRSGALASCVVDRIIDSLGVGVLGIVSLRLLATQGSAAEFARHASTVVTIAFTLLCVLLVIAYFVRDRMVELVRRLVGVVGYANALWLLQFGQQVVLGLVFVAMGHESLSGLFRLSEGEAA